MRLLTLFLSLAAILPPAAFAAAPCTAAQLPESDAARAELWRGAIERFGAARPDLTAAQQRFLREALPLVEDLAPLQAKRFVEQARELFTHDQLGALFTSMGPMQRVLSSLAAVPAYCDCPPNPCVGGTCVSGCVSWTGDDGVRHDGLCVMPAPGGGL